MDAKIIGTDIVLYLKILPAFGYGFNQSFSQASFKRVPDTLPSFDFEVSWYDHYNHTHYKKYETTSEYKDGQWVITFPAEDQQKTGFYNLRCTVTSSDEGLKGQQLVFQKAFALDNPVHPDHWLQAVELDSTVMSYTVDDFANSELTVK